MEPPTNQEALAHTVYNGATLRIERYGLVGEVWCGPDWNAKVSRNGSWIAWNKDCASAHDALSYIDEKMRLHGLTLMSQPHLSKLARQFIIELRGLDKPAPINRMRYETIKRLYLAAGLDGDDSRAVDGALDSAWRRVGGEDSGQHDCWG